MNYSKTGNEINMYGRKSHHQKFFRLHGIGFYAKIFPTKINFCCGQKAIFVVNNKEKTTLKVSI